MKSKLNSIVRIGVTAVLVVAATTAMAISESQCRAQGGEPEYTETMTMPEDCGFFADWFGLCRVGEVEREYTGSCDLG